MKIHLLPILGLLVTGIVAGCVPAGESRLIAIPTLVAPAAEMTAPAGGPAVTAATAEPAAMPAVGGNSEPVPTQLPAATAPAVPTTAADGLFIDGTVPAAAVDALEARLAGIPGWRRAADPAGSRLQFVVDEGVPAGRWVYAAVTAFPTLRDEITLAELAQNGPLLADPETAALWQGTLPLLEPVAAEELVERLWSDRTAIAVMPFEALSPQVKVLRVDGVSPLEAGLDGSAYPLVRNLGLTGGDEDAVLTFLRDWTSLTNRDESRLTRLAMTGVTALVRATAHQMEVQGINFPAGEVGPLLAAADVTHISNEIPFVSDCPFPDPVSPSLVFCSRDGYLELLETVGADVIELTGNHANDYGPANFLHTLDLYRAAGMVTYGGGATLPEAGQPAIVEDHGNRLAFVGCNPVGPVGGFATVDRAGMNPCDYEQMARQIEELKAAGHFVVATFQYFEHYEYRPTAQMIADFGRMAAAGADIVSGSQAHVPHGFALVGNSFIHYGVGNLFFDQMDRLDTRQMFIDLYAIYDGRLIGVDLWTGLIEFYARPRAMTGEERRAFLQTMFQASGW